jgi:hypothetical protein
MAKTESEKIKATKKPQNPKSEQTICITCGFCCDGTLFDQAALQPGEKGDLPRYMEESYFKNEKGEYFRLPCGYFDEKCSIYEHKKAHVCSAFRCQLLKDFSKKKITQANAKKLVKNAMAQRKEILALSEKLLRSPEKIPFRKLLLELHKKIHLEKENYTPNPELDILTARCNIFEALLIRYFKSEDDFNSMKVPLHGEDPNKED